MAELMFHIILDEEKTVLLLGVNNEVGSSNVHLWTVSGWHSIKWNSGMSIKGWLGKTAVTFERSDKKHKTESGKVLY